MAVAPLHPSEGEDPPASATSAATPREAEAEQRFVLYGVPWEQYITLRDVLDERSGLKMTYLDGTLELMSPSFSHEDLKKTIARVVEIYAMDEGIELEGAGSMTFRREAEKRGLEPDECYAVGRRVGDDGLPDFAIEVALSSGYIEKLDVYQGLRIPEVWFWKAGQIIVYRLVGERYEVRERSEVLPNLDLALLASCAGVGGQTRAVREFRARMRERR